MTINLADIETTINLADIETTINLADNDRVVCFVHIFDDCLIAILDSVVSISSEGDECDDDVCDGKVSSKSRENKKHEWDCVTLEQHSGRSDVYQLLSEISLDEFKVSLMNNVQRARTRGA